MPLTDFINFSHETAAGDRSVAARHLARAAVERGLDLVEPDAVAGKRGEREVKHVRRLVDHVIARLGRGELGRFLAELGAEQRGLGEQLRGVGALRRGLAAQGEAAGEGAETVVLAEAGARAEMAEARRLLADREAKRIAVAVGSN